MFPIRDDNPHFLTPYVTYGIIALNIAPALHDAKVVCYTPRGPADPVLWKPSTHEARLSLGFR